MSDYERYGDYDEKEYDEVKKSGWFATFLKICVFALCIGIVGILVFRMVIFKSYPESMTNIYFTDELTEYYNENGGEISAKTQELRTPYDNAQFANFMCDNLIIIEGVSELQLSVRYNDSMIQNAEEKYSLSGLMPNDEGLLSFRLVDNNGSCYEAPTYRHYEEKYMYNYIKLVFSGVNFDKDSVKWIRLEVFVNEAHSDEPFAMIPVYENHEGYNVFDEYVLKEEERP